MLSSIAIEHTQVDNGHDFRSSLSRCSKFETLSSYKLWGIGGHRQKLMLPECMGLSLYRADDADWLDIHAPNLVNLNLQACYGLKHARLSQMKA